MSASLTSNGNHVNDYSDLHVLLQTLQTNSLLRSFTQQTPPTTPSFHTFFLIHLPLLLTTQRPQAIHNLRIAYITVMHLSSSLEQSVKTRYVNFGRALLWELDRADHLIQSMGDCGEFEITNAVRTIFHLVASLCYREWDMHQPPLFSQHDFVDATHSGNLPSTQDPVYHPPPRVTSRSARNSVIVGDASEQVNHEQHVCTNLQHSNQTRSPCPSHCTTHDKIPLSEVQPLSSCSPLHQVIQTSKLHSTVHIDIPNMLPCPSDYIRNNGKHILPAACINEIKNGCHVPFELFVQDNREEDIFGILGHFTCNVGSSYPDNTHLSYIPIQDIRLFNYCAMTGFAEQDKFNAMASVEISTKVYETLINSLKEAYITKFPDRLSVFLTDFASQQAIADRGVKMKLPLLSGCFARVVHLLWFVEHPLCDALEMCQHDVSGCGLLQAELVEGAEGIRIVISLAGVVVERNLLNYGEKIFELLDTGVVSELESVPPCCMKKLKTTVHIWHFQYE